MRELLWLQSVGTGDSELIGRDQIASLQEIGRTSVQLDIIGSDSSIGRVEREASELTVTSLAPIVAVGRAVESAVGDRRRIALFVPDPTVGVDWTTFGSRCHRILTTERSFVDRMVQVGMDDVVLVDPNVSIRPSELPVADPRGIVAYAHAKARDWLSVEAFCEAWLRSTWTERAMLFLSSPDVPLADCVRSIEAVATRCGRGDVGSRVGCIGPSTADQVDAMILRADLIVDVPITGCGWPAVLAKACRVGKPIMCTRVDGISSHVADASWVQVPEAVGGRLGCTDLPRDHLVDLFRVSVERWPVESRVGRMLPSKLPTMSEACEAVTADLSLEGA
jgi:hypothetical protein